MPLFAANPFEQDVGKCWFRAGAAVSRGRKWAVATPGTGKPKPRERRGRRRPEGLFARSLAAGGGLPAHLRLETPGEAFPLARRRNGEEGPGTCWRRGRGSSRGADGADSLLPVEAVSTPRPFRGRCRCGDPAVQGSPALEALTCPIPREESVPLAPTQMHPGPESGASAFVYRLWQCYSLSLAGASAMKCCFGV